MSKEDREKRGEPAYREERDDESAAPACLILESEPSSEIQDPSRERAAGTSHSPGRGARRSPTWPAGGEGRTPPTPCACRARHVTPRHEPTSQQHIHEVLRHRPVFRARSLPPGSKNPDDICTLHVALCSRSARWILRGWDFRGDNRPVVSSIGEFSLVLYGNRSTNSVTESERSKRSRRGEFVTRRFCERDYVLGYRDYISERSSWWF